MHHFFRQVVLVQTSTKEKNEANAIAAEDMRADLLSPEDAVKVHRLLKQYLDQRLLFYTTHDLHRLE